MSASTFDIEHYFSTVLSRWESLEDAEERVLQPHDYGGYEDLLSRALSQKEYMIGLPKNSMFLAVIDFIISCPESLWKECLCPVSLLSKKSVRSGAEELLGKEVAAICTGLFRYYGGLNVFDLLRRRYALVNDGKKFKLLMHL